MLRFPPLTPAVRALLIALVSLFVLEAILENFLGVPIFEWLALNTRALSPATAWQLFTHVLASMPSQGMVLPLFVSLAFIWLILAPFEARYGQDRLVQLVLVSAITAGLPALLVGQITPQLAGSVWGPGSITMTAVAAYAMLLPAHAEVSFFGLFPMTSKHLIGVVLAFSVFDFLTSKNLAQLAADLGAFGGGVAFCRLWMQRAPRRKQGKAKAPRSGVKLHAVPNDDDKPKRWLN